MAEKVATNDGGGMSRRRFTTLLLSASPLALGISRAWAGAGKLVFVNWGGDAGSAYDRAYGAPFRQETGIPVRQDESGPTEEAVAAQFEGGQPAWDVVDIDPFSAQALGKRGIMEPIDYSVVDRSRMRPGFGWEFAASSYFYSYIIAYDATKFGDAVPRGMADFFDVEKFPGKRSLYQWGSGMWEAALLADGVEPRNLYPLDLDRAHRKIAAFKQHVLAYWGSGNESQSLLLSGEVSMALIWSTRAGLVEKDSGGSISFIWDQGLIAPGAMGVIKGNPGGREAAMAFIASAQDPQKQVVMFEMLGQGPANPAADGMLTAEQARLNPVDPANMAMQIPLDMEWYEANYGAALKEYTRVISA